MRRDPPTSSSTYLRRGNNLQKLLLLLLLNVVAAVSVPIDGTANITMNKCETDYQRPVLKSGMKVICKGSNCTGNYRAGFNKSGCYDMCIQDISHPTNASKENLHLEFGKAEFAKSIRVTFSADDVCRTPDPSVTPAVDHHKQHNTTEERPPTPVPTTPVPDLRLPTSARPGLGIGILLVVVVIVTFIFQMRQRWKQSIHKINQNEGCNVPLTEVSCSGEARGLVTTALEHQDGAAGEENLLGNGTVQL